MGDKPISSERMLHKEYDNKSSEAKTMKFLFISVKGVGTKTN
jgi:hypothetical protein